MPNIVTTDHTDPRIREIAGHFDYDHLPPVLRGFSQQCYDLAANMIHDLDSSEELYVGLRKLLEAKDAFVRAALPLQEKANRDELPK